MADLERREPMPDVSALPGWFWRRLGVRGRIALGLVLAATVAALVIAVPQIDEDKREQRAEDAAAAVAAERAETARVKRVQAPHRARIAAPSTLETARAELAERITADARARQAAGELPTPPAVRTTACTPVSTARAERYRKDGVDYLRCLATLSENAAVSSGYEFIASTRPKEGRLVWCKVEALPGEKFNAVSLADLVPSQACYRP